MLLELLSDFQISIPELGRIEARTHPVVLLTSNNSRELTEALKRRCLYLWLDYPSAQHELEIVRLHTPELPESVARQARRGDRAGARARPQEAAVDRRVDRLGARAAAARRRRDRRGRVPLDDVDHRQAPDRPRRRVRARRRAARARPAAGVTPPGPDRRLRGGPAGRGGGGRDVGAARRVRRARRGAVDRPAGVPRGARGDAGEVARRPARVRARVRALLLPRRRGAGRRARRARGAATPTA